MTRKRLSSGMSSTSHQCKNMIQWLTYKRRCLVAVRYSWYFDTDGHRAAKASAPWSRALKKHIVSSMRNEYAQNRAEI